MFLSRRTFLLTSLAALPAASLASEPEQNWPEFRGPGARGVADGHATRTTWNVDSTTSRTAGLLWRAEVPGLGHSSPIIWGNRVYVATAVRLSGKAPLLAIRPTAQGDISLPEGKTNNDAVVWSAPNGGSYISTPVVYRSYLYLATHNGVLRCFDFKTGEKVYEERTGASALFSASPVAADGKNYCSAEEGVIYVIKAGPKLEVLAKNDLGEPCLATPAISQGVVYFRTSGSLMAIG
jgi:outer membrane protein assembly factor BamB